MNLHLSATVKTTNLLAEHLGQGQEAHDDEQPDHRGEEEGRSLERLQSPQQRQHGGLKRGGGRGGG